MTILAPEHKNIHMNIFSIVYLIWEKAALWDGIAAAHFKGGFWNIISFVATPRDGTAPVFTETKRILQVESRKLVDSHGEGHLKVTRACESAIKRDCHTSS